MTAPQITVAEHPIPGVWSLMVSSRIGPPDIAGPRILRSAPHPDIQWRHATEAGALADAATLQRYLEEVYAKRGPSKKKLRKQGAD
jgi:hypothetical protein